MPPIEHDEIRSRIYHYLISKTNFLQVKDQMPEEQLRTFVDQAITGLCREAQITVALEERAAIIRELVSSMVSLGPIRPLVEDPMITEIMINGPKKAVETIAKYFFECIGKLGH